MEVPPGRAERISDGGPEAIRALLKELRAMKFNGLLKTSVYRGDTPSQGVLVLRGGDGVLAEHRSKVDVAGPTYSFWRVKRQPHSAHGAHGVTDDCGGGDAVRRPHPGQPDLNAEQHRHGPGDGG